MPWQGQRIQLIALNVLLESIQTKVSSTFKTISQIVFKTISQARRARDAASFRSALSKHGGHDPAVSTFFLVQRPEVNCRIATHPFPIPSIALFASHTISHLAEMCCAGAAECTLCDAGTYSAQGDFPQHIANEL